MSIALEDRLAHGPEHISDWLVLKPSGLSVQDSSEAHALI
jgi:cytochrome c-type biogenesis protein CcmH/NrfG